jgi:hypothetical protein
VDIDEEMNKLREENEKMNADLRADLLVTMKHEIATVKSFMTTEINKQIGALDVKLHQSFMGTPQEIKENTTASIDEMSRTTGTRNDAFLKGIQTQIDRIVTPQIDTYTPMQVTPAPNPKRAHREEYDTDPMDVQVNKSLNLYTDSQISLPKSGTDSSAGGQK